MNIIELAIYKKMFGGSSGTTVSGTINLNTNGEYDISKYEKAIVDVPMPTTLVIEVDELPTENINFDAVYICGGELYRYSDTWVFKDVITQPNAEFEVPFHFRCGTLFYTNISYNGEYETLTFYRSYDETAYIFGENRWCEEYYKTLVINELPTDETFLTWLRANTKQGGWRKYTLTNE